MSVHKKYVLLKCQKPSKSYLSVIDMVAGSRGATCGSSGLLGDSNSMQSCQAWSPGAKYVV